MWHVKRLGGGGFSCLAACSSSFRHGCSSLLIALLLGLAANSRFSPISKLAGSYLAAREAAEGH